MKISRGLTVSGIACEPSGSCTFRLRSASANWLTTMKKISRLKTMSIMGVRSKRPSALPRLIWMGIFAPRALRGCGPDTRRLFDRRQIAVFALLAESHAAFIAFKLREQAEGQLVDVM